MNPWFWAAIACKNDSATFFIFVYGFEENSPKVHILICHLGVIKDKQSVPAWYPAFLLKIAQMATRVFNLFEWPTINPYDIQVWVAPEDVLSKELGEHRLSTRGSSTNLQGVRKDFRWVNVIRIPQRMSMSWPVGIVLRRYHFEERYLLEFMWAKKSWTLTVLTWWMRRRRTQMALFQRPRIYHKKWTQSDIRIGTAYGQRWKTPTHQKIAAL